MQPSRLDLEPGSSSAAKQWKHWLKTFENYIEDLTANQPAGQGNIDKLKVLINCVSHHVYDHIEECDSYETAIRVLNELYVKTPNTIFARHLLATAKQDLSQSLDDFLLTLTTLSKDCNFTDLTAEEYRKEMIRDSFINGISSQVIRQRLLENSELSLERAFEQARTLDSAQKSSDVYASSGSGYNAMITSEMKKKEPPPDVFVSTTSTEASTLAAATNVSKLCYFRGRSCRSSSARPAKNAVLTSSFTECGKQPTPTMRYVTNATEKDISQLFAN